MSNLFQPEKIYEGVNTDPDRDIEGLSPFHREKEDKIRKALRHLEIVSPNNERLGCLLIAERAISESKLVCFFELFYYDEEILHKLKGLNYGFFVTYELNEKEPNKFTFRFEKLNITNSENEENTLNNYQNNLDFHVRLKLLMNLFALMHHFNSTIESKKVHFTHLEINENCFTFKTKINKEDIHININLGRESMEIEFLEGELQEFDRINLMIFSIRKIIKHLKRLIEEELKN